MEVRTREDVVCLDPDDDSPPSPKKSKVAKRGSQGSATYATTYQVAWEEMFDFVRRSSVGKHHSHCKICYKDISISHQGVGDIK